MAVKCMSDAGYQFLLIPLFKILQRKNELDQSFCIQQQIKISAILI
jgi:hypothetical protein